MSFESANWEDSSGAYFRRPGRYANGLAQAALRVSEGISARSATTATNAPARAIAVGIVVVGTMPATARSAAMIGTTTERTAAMVRRRIAPPSAAWIRG